MAEENEILKELEALFPGRVVTPVRYVQESWWPLAWINRSYLGSAVAAVVPESVEDVVRLVRFAYERGVPLNIVGGGSSVTGASAPRGGVVVDLKRLNKIREVDSRRGYAVAEAGVVLQELEQVLNQGGLTLGQFPQSMDIATLGGFISTMGSGHSSSGYGNVEDVLSRLEVVVPPGEVYWTSFRRVPRSSPGPDLSKVFVGAEGAFGVITAAEVKLYDLPKFIWEDSALFSTFEEGVEAVEKLASLDLPPKMVRLYDELETAYYTGLEGAVLIFRFATQSKAFLEAARSEVSDILRQGFRGPELVHRLLQERQNYREHITRILHRGLIVDTVEIAASWDKVADLHRAVKEALRGVEGVYFVTAHLSHIYRHGACLYFTILFTPSESLYFKLWDAVYSEAERFGATISHHHGTGVVKQRYLELEKPAELYRRLKAALDPKGILNPGRLVP